MSQINFREIVKEMIIKKGISIAKLARKADMHHGTLYNYLNEISEMTSGKLENLLNTLEALPNRRKKGVQE